MEAGQLRVLCNASSYGYIMERNGNKLKGLKTRPIRDTIATSLTIKANILKKDNIKW